MDHSPRNEEDLFAAALELPRTIRVEFLRRACGDDAALRRRLEAMLAASESSGGFLAHPAEPGLLKMSDQTCARHAEEKPGDWLGRYRLLQKIGEGGCGVVYMAEQVEPLRRRVALKVIKLGMDTKEVIARFESERQALALMDHPNVARVFDAGTTETGRPYFVMELVRGIKITDYCDERQLTTEERLQLFVQVCHAIQHAHQKGVIHRDIKPSNILVTQHDGVALPKVIDFGVAKATHGRLTDRTVFTAFAQFIGTPAYMSPEQAEMTDADVDTRSDIYSLGVLLYELLVGQPPFDPTTLIRSGLAEMRRIIREEEPARPSARFNTFDSTGRTTLANRRRVAPTLLDSRLRGDLDWIVMKTLEKNRNRRYETADALASDLTSHLLHQPVLARPPTPSYLLGRFVRRHRTGVAAGSTILGVLILAAVVSTALAVRATRSEQRTERVMQVFKRMLDGLGQTATLNPSSNLDQGGVEWRRILDETADKATGNLRDQPEVEAELRHVFGKIYLANANYPRAEELLRSALALYQSRLGPEHPDSIATLYDLGLTLMPSDRWDEQETLLHKAFVARRKTLGADHPETVKTLEVLAFVIMIHGDFGRAESLFREAFESRRRTGRIEDLDNAHMVPQQGLAQCLLAEGRFQEGEKFARENLEVATRKLGPQHRLVSQAYLLLAWSLNGQKKHAEALPFCRAMVAIDRATLEPNHPDLSNSLYELGACLDNLGWAADVSEVEQLYRESLAIWRSRRASINPNNMIYRLTSLGTFLAKQDRFSEGAAQFDEAWNILKACGSPTCVQYEAATIKGAIDLLMKWGRTDAAQAKLVEIWTERMDRFEVATKAEPAGIHRTAAVRGLAEVFAEWAKTDPSKTASATFWAEKQQAETRAEPVNQGGRDGASLIAP